ncbi:selenoprotein S B-like [Corticium candelabrum]|uniref:selenoprotein S B-like n=1 Tax=Corticium candelabrum TaxID=121492 RepID=UPI002E26BD17|nr:selenoprotein S B-like [Corticium candelabrum]
MDDAGGANGNAFENVQVPEQWDEEHARLREANRTPEFLFDVLWFVQRNGWYILIGCIILYFLWDYVLRDLWDKFRETAEERSARLNYDPEEEESRQQAKMLVLEKLQQSLDEKAEEWLVKKKELEAKKRDEMISDWERHQQGRGYRSKLKPRKPEEDAGKPKPRPNSNSRLFRREYNPLTGSSDRPSYRPSRGSGSQGGG